MHTFFDLMAGEPAIQQTHLLSFSFYAIEMDEGSKAINIIALAEANPYFEMDMVMVCACLVPLTQWDHDQQMVETICGVFILINEL